ncbi:hypothetical protein ACP70R_020577 [Stipagrostis hirtigluma subsp. patula]
MHLNLFLALAAPLAITDTNTVFPDTPLTAYSHRSKDMRTCYIVLLLVAMAVAVAAPTAADDGWEPVEDVHDPHIQELGRWAVEQSHSVLSFDEVVSGRYQDTDDGPGTYYELAIEAAPRVGGDQRYKAVVYEQDWSDSLELISFQGTRPAAAPLDRE